MASFVRWFLECMYCMKFRNTNLCFLFLTIHPMMTATMTRMTIAPDVPMMTLTNNGVAVVGALSISVRDDVVERRSSRPTSLLTSL